MRHAIARVRQLFLFIALVIGMVGVVTPTEASASSSNGTISGIVTQGGDVVSAPVEVRDAFTGAFVTSGFSDAGGFIFDVAPGVYTVSAFGHGVVAQTFVSVSAAETTSVTLELPAPFPLPFPIPFPF